MKNKNEKKGYLEFKYIKDSKCPKCGVGVESYRLSPTSKWMEVVYFSCVYGLRSETPTIIKEINVCENSKDWKNLLKIRLNDIDKLNKFVNENTQDPKVTADIKNKLNSLTYDIKRWWRS